MFQNCCAVWLAGTVLMPVASGRLPFSVLVTSPMPPTLMGVPSAMVNMLLTSQPPVSLLITPELALPHGNSYSPDATSRRPTLKPESPRLEVKSYQFNGEP